MSLRPYREQFVYHSINNLKSTYELEILPQIKGDAVVIITGLKEGAADLMTNPYETIATQVYHQRLWTINAKKVIWIKKSVHKKNDNQEAFSEVDLTWDQEAKFFHSPQLEPCDPKVIASIRMFCEECVR